MKNGWHTIAGYEVYVEDDCVLRGVKLDRNGSETAAYVYRKASQKYGGGYDLCENGVSVSAFRAAVKRGTMILA